LIDVIKNVEIEIVEVKMKDVTLLLKMTKEQKEEIRKSSELTNISMTELMMNAWKNNLVGSTEVEILQKVLRNEIESVQTMINLFKQKVETSAIDEIETIKESVGKSIIFLNDSLFEIPQKVELKIGQLTSAAQKNYVDTMRIGEAYLIKQGKENLKLFGDMIEKQNSKIRSEVIIPLVQKIGDQTIVEEKLKQATSTLISEHKRHNMQELLSEIKLNIVIVTVFLSITGTFSLTTGWVPVESTSFKLFYILTATLFTSLFVAKESQKTFVPVFTILKQKFSHS